MTAPVTIQWTVDALQALPGGGLDFEVVDGRRHRVPFHTASHENAIALLAHLLADYLSGHPQWECRRAPTELVVGPRTLLRPDLMLVRPADGAAAGTSAAASVPALVVEVLSPTTARLDRGTKRMEYRRLGVPDLWLVDLELGIVERWREGAAATEIIRDQLVWQADPAVPPFKLFLPAFFSEVHLDD